MQTLKISLSPELFSILEMIARNNHVPVEIAAAQILGDSVRKKRHETVRILQQDRTDRQDLPEPDILREIIKRQDAEIAWLRDHISRISTTLLIKPEYPSTLQDRQETEEGQNRISGNKQVDESSTGLEEVNQSPVVTVDDVQYSPAAGDAGGLEDLMNRSLEDEGARFQGQERASERMLRDSIGGVREEKEYSISEAAAIAGETEAVILEFIMDGFLPAIKDGNSFRIQGNDLRRYIMSK